MFAYRRNRPAYRDRRRRAAFSPAEFGNVDLIEGGLLLRRGLEDFSDCGWNVRLFREWKVYWSEKRVIEDNYLIFELFFNLDESLTFLTFDEST